MGTSGGKRGDGMTAGAWAAGAAAGLMLAGSVAWAQPAGGQSTVQNTSCKRDVAQTDICDWAPWVMGPSGAVLIADLKTPATYQVCRDQFQNEPDDQALTVLATGASVSAPPGTRVGLPRYSCALITGAKIVLQASGTPNRRINGFFRPLDLPPFKGALQWSAYVHTPAAPKVTTPILAGAAERRVRVCQPPIVPELPPAAWRKERRIFRDGAAVTAAGSAPAGFAMGGCVDLEAKSLTIDPNWADANDRVTNGYIAY